MTTDIKNVLKDLDSKIAVVYDLELVGEMTDIYNDLVDRVDELSMKYWKLVKALAKTEKDRDDLLSKYNETLKKNNETLKKNNAILADIIKVMSKGRELRKKAEKERDQAEYDRDYYRDEVEQLRKELAWKI